MFCTILVFLKMQRGLIAMFDQDYLESKHSFVCVISIPNDCVII